MPGLVLVMQEDIPVKKLSLCVVVAGLLLWGLLKKQQR